MLSVPWEQIYKLTECAFDSVLDGSAARNDGTLTVYNSSSLGAQTPRCDITVDADQEQRGFKASCFSHKCVTSDYQLAVCETNSS